MVPICSLRSNAEDIRRNLLACGAVRLTSVLDISFVQHAFNRAHELFRLSHEKLQSCVRQGMGSGYTPPGVEGVRDLPKDQYRSFWDVLSPVTHTNCFPADTQEIAGQLEGLYLRLEMLATDFLEITFSELLPFSKNGGHGLRCTHFVPQAQDVLVMPCHLDVGFITVYVGGSLPGLQAKHAGSWFDVVNPIGDVVIGIGTTLRLYEPSFAPLAHRVVGCGEERLSMAYFHEPRADVFLPNGELAADRMKRIVGRIRG